MKEIPFAVVIALIGAVPANAQVACSPKVESSTCQAVASQWNGALDHMILRDAIISVEILTPGEYAQRVVQIHQEDAALGTQCVGCPPAYLGAPKYQVFDNLWTENILFLRERHGRNPFPGKILVSSDAFADIATDKNGQPILEDFENDHGKGKRVVMDHKFHVGKANEILEFIAGYFSGLWASYADSEVVPLKDSK
jgi:hypothetical protein